MGEAPELALDRGKQRERRALDLRLLVRVISPVFILALAVGAVFDYQRSTRGAETRFNERQAFLARHVAERLAEIFREADKFLSLLGHMPQVMASGPRGGHVLATVVAQLQEHGATAAARVSARGDVTLAVGATMPQMQALIRQLPRCKLDQGICVNGPIKSALTNSKWLLVATSALPRQQEQAGQLLLVLDWKRLQQHISRTSSFGPGSYSWVLDHEGRLIMHPEHRDQLGKSALTPGPACSRCHDTFELHTEMTKGRNGTGRIQVAGNEPKLVAFTPLQVGSKQWSLAVATPSRLVTTAARRDLMATVLFTGAIMLVMVAGALLLDREASRRIREASRFHKRLEEEVRHRTEQLQGVHQRLAQFQAQHTRLERVAVAGEMASIVAHEIRTPLNALSINVQMITRMLSKGASDQTKAKGVLNTIQGEVQRINSLVQDNLLAHVRRPKAELLPVYVDEVLRDSIRFMESEARRNKVTLEYDPGAELPCAQADESKLRQVLLNIILNAVQAMPDGGEVALATEAKQEQLVIRISDTGPGFKGLDEASLHEVFRPFVTTKKHGTGLGLAICARLIKEMHGSISICSGPGQGACFEISLPIFQEEGDSCR